MRNVGEQMAAKRSLFVCSKQVLIEEVERKQKNTFLHFDSNEGNFSL